LLKLEFLGFMYRGEMQILVFMLPKYKKKREKLTSL